MSGSPIADLIELGGAGLAVVEAEAQAPAGAGVVRVGVHRAARRPVEGLDGFDILLSADPAAPRPWVGVADLDAAIARLEAEVARQPAAAAVAAQVLRASLDLSFDQALVQESLAYSMLLASEGFRAWRAANPPRDRPDDPAPRVLIGHDGEALTLTLNRPAARNAVDARMRDELCEALAFAAEHPDAPRVVLSGAGPAFSAGGDLDEFGSAADPGHAHLIRTLRSPARLVHDLGDRITARLHGACVGAGIEVPAAVARVVAAEGAFFRLPEVSMGLIPGAGGTATIPRRIGRHRAAWMAISGADIDLPTALAWGLVDAVRMRTFEDVLAGLSARIRRLSGQLGERVDVAALGVTDRQGQLALDPPTRISCNRACRMVRAADGWIAVNLAREEDRELVPAWLHGEVGEEPWAQVERLAPTRPRAELIADAAMLGLPTGAVGEVVGQTPRPDVQLRGRARRRAGAPNVVDLSAMWAGPMCGAILAAAGCTVTRVESVRRPDPTRTATPEFYRRLNGAKRELALDFADPGGRAALRDAVLAADVVITGARPRAFASLGFDPEEIVAGGGVWVSVTGYGWGHGQRVAFGDDAAAAGGLVEWAGGEPRFLGDALADPVTGLAAAVGALEALHSGGAMFVDAGLAPCAAGAAHAMGLAA